MKKTDKRKKVLVAVLAALFTALQITGYQLSMLYGTSVHRSDFFQQIGILSTGQCLLLAVVEFVFWCIILCLAFSLLKKLETIEMRVSRKSAIVFSLIVTITLFACWIPCLLAGYPGFYNYDAMVQVPQALYEEVAYSAHHPLIHTLFMGKIIAYGYHHGVDLNDGIILHSIIQMLLCAMAFAYFVYYLLKITGRYWIAAIAFLYYAFFPPIAMFAISTTKDTIFSVLLLFSVVFTYEMCKNMQAFFTSACKVIKFITVIVLMCLFRKNGIYAVMCITPPSSCCFTKNTENTYLAYS